MEFVSAIQSIIIVISLILISIKKNKTPVKIFFGVIFLCYLLYNFIFTEWIVNVLNYQIDMSLLISSTILYLLVLFIPRYNKNIIEQSPIYIYSSLLSKYIIALILDISISDIYTIGISINNILFLIFFSVFYIGSLLLYKLITNNSKNTLKIIYLILIISQILSFSLMNYYIYELIITNKKSYYLCVTFNIIAILLFSICTICIIYIQNKDIETVKKMKQYEIEKITNQYNNIYLESQNDLHKIKHDIANIVSSINQESIKEELTNKIHDINKIYFTDHKLLNSLLVIKSAQAKDLNISFEITSIIPNDIPISDYDLISIFANLIDNAIEASSKTQEKTITLNTIYKEDELIIEITNSALSFSKKTTKIDKINHGYGTLIIKDIVKKYHGSAYFNFEHSIVYTNIILRNKTVKS